MDGWGGGHSLIWPVRVCATEQGMVFRVLSRKHGIPFQQGVFLDCMEAGLEAFQKKCTLFERQCI